MSDIQQARDVLAKWREASATGYWDLDFGAATFTANSSPNDGGYVGDTDNPYDARLIVGTAGNPELLDAIDSVLAVALHMAPRHRGDAAIIAAAILAADDRMGA